MLSFICLLLLLILVLFWQFIWLHRLQRPPGRVQKCKQKQLRRRRRK
ncbi:E5 zeta [Macaca fuscata papillomavirus 1]|uniref:E5 zeta n=1 Tax=Macaca fuscata papillomavirus 1 TaxID=1816787 RepID=A0A142K3F4_RHPV1|nr:E5 zeta [Macaca fuscata papillomavirus 1]